MPEAKIGKPLGLKIIARIEMIAGSVALVWGTGAIIGMSRVPFLSIFAPIIILGAFLPLGIGLLKLKNKARSLNLAFIIFCLAAAISSFTGIPWAFIYNLGIREILSIEPALIILHLFFISVLLCPVIYLTRPKVKAQFK